MDSYDEHEFRTRVDAALRRIRTVLDNTRNPQYPADVPHAYDDKYALAEFVTRVTVASLVQCLEVIGMTGEQLQQLREWARARSVTIRLAAREDCRFLREETRKVESAQEYVTETRSFLGTKSTKSEKVVTTVTEYFWAFEFHYEVVAFQGTDADKPVVLHARSGAIEIKTGARTTPRPKAVVRPHLDVNVTWLLQHVDDASRASFEIDRTDPACRTPRRNPEVERALYACEEFYLWAGHVASYFFHELFTAQQDHGRDLAAINDEEVFVPVVPLFEGDGAARSGQRPGEGVLPASFANAFLAEERRSLDEKCRSLSAAFPRDASVITAVEAGLLVTLAHAQNVCQQYATAVAYVEEMLHRQLIAAIGKEVTPADFTSYMDFHHRKLVKPEYRPRPFSYAIRRPDHDPEGVLSVEAERVGGAMREPISTTVACAQAQRPMSFALDAATRVSFLGERYVHAWVAHQFSGQAPLALSLVARARQFSSFILLVGRIASADAFEPRFGVIVQNKDLLAIPLMLEQIPTPKEFRDAIESLSPEQQRFARAFRGMQLESTLFGVCVIQIKPQLEKLLKLPPDSLTKEIKLSQELLNLFVEYQIPSDLLSYDGPPEAPTGEKLARVKDYVARMQEMIDTSKQREIEQERQREALRLAEMNRTPVAPPMAPPPASAPMGFASAAPAMAAGPARGRRSAAPGGAAPPPAPAPAAPPPPPVSFSAPQESPRPQPSQPVDSARERSAAPETATATTTPRHEAAVAPGRAATHPSAGPPDGGEFVDYTRLPGELDRKFETLDEDAALRATIINPGDTWTRTAQKGLLSPPATTTLRAREQKDEKHKAFDLLDALTKSGALAVEDASLHVVIAATHRFDRTLVDTVVQDNVNPIEKVERSMMIVGTTIHRLPASELLADDQRERFFASSPRLSPGANDANRPPARLGGGAVEP